MTRQALENYVFALPNEFIDEKTKRYSNSDELFKAFLKWRWDNGSVNLPIEAFRIFIVEEVEGVNFFELLRNASERGYITFDEEEGDDFADVIANLIREVSPSMNLEEEV